MSSNNIATVFDLFRGLQTQFHDVQSYLSRLLATSGIISAGFAALNCTFSDISTLLPSHATLSFVVPVPRNGSFGTEGNLAFPRNATHLPELCAVSINVKSSPSSNYNFGLFLPQQWNSRFLTAGNGGFGGGINWPVM